MSRSWVEIEGKKLLNNISQVRQILDKNANLMVVVKSNAYGHGILEVSSVINDVVDWFGVDSLPEAEKLRNSGISKPILIMGYTEFSEIEKIAEYNLSQVVYNTETIDLMQKKWKENGKKFKIHIKIETGTNRQGVLINDLPEFLDRVTRSEGIIIEGISTHFANIEDTTDPSYAMKQVELYKQALDIVSNKAIEIPIKHIASSAAAILFPQTHYNMIRLGISLYGLWSSKEANAVARRNVVPIQLSPCLTWKTKIAQIKEVDEGSCISYGCTEKLSRKSKIAVIPVGYWDGFDRRLSSIGNVLVGGKRCKILGRICMNMCVIDVTDIEAKLEDEVVLLGRQDNEEITAEEIAGKISTINYEIITKINPTIRRVIV